MINFDRLTNKKQRDLNPITLLVSWRYVRSSKNSLPLRLWSRGRWRKGSLWVALSNRRCVRLRDYQCWRLGVLLWLPRNEKLFLVTIQLFFCFRFFTAKIFSLRNCSQCSVFPFVERQDVVHVEIVFPIYEKWLMWPLKLNTQYFWMCTCIQHQIAW